MRNAEKFFCAVSDVMRRVTEAAAQRLRAPALGQRWPSAFCSESFFPGGRAGHVPPAGHPFTGLSTASLERVEPVSHERSPEVIRSDEAYTTRELRRRMGIGDYAWRGLRKELRIVEFGRKQFVLGRDVLRYLDSHEAQPDEGLSASEALC